MQVLCLRYKKKHTPFWVSCKDGTVLCYLSLEKLRLPDISYYLSNGRFLIHIGIGRKELNSVLHRLPCQGAWGYRVSAGNVWPCVGLLSGCDRKFDLQLLSQCGSSYNCLLGSVNEIHLHVAGGLSNQNTSLCHPFFISFKSVPISISLYLGFHLSLFSSFLLFALVWLSSVFVFVGGRGGGSFSFCLRSFFLSVHYPLYFLSAFVLFFFFLMFFLSVFSLVLFFFLSSFFPPPPPPPPPPLLYSFYVHFPSFLLTHCTQCKKKLRLPTQVHTLSALHRKLWITETFCGNLNSLFIYLGTDTDAHTCLSLPFLLFLVWLPPPPPPPPPPAPHSFALLLTFPLSLSLSPPPPLSLSLSLCLSLSRSRTHAHTQPHARTHTHKHTLS